MQATASGSHLSWPGPATAKHMCAGLQLVLLQSFEEQFQPRTVSFSSTSFHEKAPGCHHSTFDSTYTRTACISSTATCPPTERSAATHGRKGREGLRGLLVIEAHDTLNAIPCRGGQLQRHQGLATRQLAMSSVLKHVDDLQVMVHKTAQQVCSSLEQWQLVITHLS